MNNNPLGPWQRKRLGDGSLTEIKYGKANPKKEGKIPVIGSSGVYDSTDEPLVDAPSILIGRKGNAGSIQLINEPCWPSDTTFYIKLKSDKLDYAYLSEYLTYRNLSSEKTQTTLPSLSIDDLNYLRIPVPPLVEQRGIVEVLGVVDESIRLTGEIIERAEELKWGLMQQLLTKGIGHTEYKETPLGEIPKTWEIKRVGDFITLQRGYDLPIQDRVDGSYPVIGSNGIVGYHNEFKVQGPGVIVGRSGTLGRVYYYEGDYWPLNTSLYVKKFRDCDRKFAYFFLQHINLNRFSTGTSVPTLNRNYVHPYKVAFPPFEEQRKIVEILDAQTVIIKKEQEKKEHLNQVKQGLMQLLLSGNIRVELKEDGLHRIKDGRAADN